MAVFFKDSNGNLFTSATPGAGAPEGFELVQANSTDAAQEKHVPAVEVEHDGRLLRVQVGETEHPMEKEHYIEWIALDADGRLEMPCPQARADPAHLLCRQRQVRQGLRVLQPPRPVGQGVLGTATGSVRRASPRSIAVPAALHEPSFERGRAERGPLPEKGDEG